MEANALAIEVKAAPIIKNTLIAIKSKRMRINNNHNLLY